MLSFFFHFQPFIHFPLFLMCVIMVSKIRIHSLNSSHTHTRSIKLPLRIDNAVRIRPLTVHVLSLWNGLKYQQNHKNSFECILHWLTIYDYLQIPRQRQFHSRTKKNVHRFWKEETVWVSF